MADPGPGATHGEAGAVLAVIGRQRAHRAFADRELDDDTVGTLLQAATFAPSAENAQPWVFVVVRRPERRAAVEALARAVWDGGAGAREAGVLSPGLHAEVDAAVHGGIAGAPVVVVVCGDRSLVPASVLGASVYPAVQNILLAATALGLGSALMTLPLAVPGQLERLLALPPGVVPLAVVPLGWPARPLGPPRRRPFSGVTHRESYGTAWAHG